MRGKILLAVILLLLAGALLFSYFWTKRDEHQIRRLLSKAAETVTKSPGETPAVGAMKSSRCRKLLMEPFSFSSDSPAWAGEKITGAEASALLFRSRTHCGELQVEIKPEKIQIQADHAIVETRCRISGSTPGRRDGFDEVRELRLRLQKRNGRWQIAVAEFSLPLQK